MPIDPVFWIFAISAVVIAGVAKGGFGGGPAMLATPVFALGADPVTAAALMLPVLCFIDWISMRAWWREVDWGDIKLLLPASLLGIFLGATFFNTFDTAGLLILLGSIAVGFAGWQVTGGARVRNPSHMVARLCGLAAGFSSTIAHAGGPPVSVYLLSRRLTPQVYVGTSTVFFTATNAVKLIPYTYLQLLPTGSLLISLSLLPVAWVGIRLGIFLHHRISQVVFYRVVYSALAAVGLILIVRGVLSL